MKIASIVVILVSKKYVWLKVLRFFCSRDVLVRSGIIV